MKIEVLKDDFSVCKVADYTGVNLEDKFCFTGRTDEEKSLVCPTTSVPQNTVEREDGWKAFRIQGTMEFSLIGILSRISTLLAENEIGIFAISTYNTDYILAKAENFQKALTVLEHKGYQIINKHVEICKAL